MAPPKQPSSIPPETEEELRRYVLGVGEYRTLNEGQRMVGRVVLELSQQQEADRIEARHRREIDDIWRKTVTDRLDELEKVTELSGIHTIEELKEGYREKAAKLEGIAEARREFWVRILSTAAIALITTGIGWVAQRLIAK